MKTLFHSFALLLSFALSLARADDIEQTFRNPPNAVGPYVWWHWMGTCISKEGITKDLESMKASGIGGATMFNLPSSVPEPTKNQPFPENTYRSPKYWELLSFAASEAKRLGLELGMHNCVGYSATGGPWITPELSMQKVVFTVTPASGVFSGLLSKPQAKFNFYRDIAVLAVPEGEIVDPKAIIDLSDKMDAEGKLQWVAPPGNWQIYRFGHTSTGMSPSPAPEGVKALEVDKMSADASRFHFEQVINPLKEQLGPLVGTSFRHLLIDSYEAGPQNWTPKFREEFTKRKGYDPVPWLPLLDTQEVVDGKGKKKVSKQTIGSAELSERFLWDFEDAIAQLYQENNFETGARIMRAAGIELHFEGYENPWNLKGPFNAIAASAIADVPMSEFWTGHEGKIPTALPGAGRAAGRRIFAAEAFTGQPTVSNFTEVPEGLKATGDAVYALGVNRMVLHHWVHQPFPDDIKPGMSMGWWGTHFGRNQTWAEPGKAFYQYLARIQSLLQRGEGIADFLALERGMENADSISRSALLRGDVRVEKGQIVLPSGRRYPFLLLPDDTAMLPEVARKLKELVAQGAVVVGPKPTRSPGLSGYPTNDEEVRKIADELWGSNGSPGKALASLPEALKKFSILTPVTFSPKDPNLRATTRRAGDTDIFFVANVGDAPVRTAASLRVTGKIPEIWNPKDGSHYPAGIWRETAGRTEVTLTLRGKESVFVVFRGPSSPADQVVSVTSADTDPTAWRLDRNDKGRPVLLSDKKLSGELVHASGKRTPLDLNPPAPLPITGAWNVAFSPGMGAPAQTQFPELTSWSEHSDLGIKYFSGTAVYRKEIDLPTSAFGPGKRLALDLGKVANIASVKINGTDLGVLWYAPFQVDATAALKPGRNTLEIAVTNTWANRLIGDEQEPEDAEWGPPRGTNGRRLVAYPDWLVKGQPRPSQGRKTFTTWNYFTKESPLYPAGLLGAVVIRQVQEIAL